MTAITLPGFTRSATAGGLPLAQAFAVGAGVRLQGSTSGTVDLFPPATVTTPYTLTLPAALGASDKLLQVDSSGNLTLVDPVSPAGSGTEIQYRNSSAFGAVAGSSWDGTTLTVPKTTRWFPRSDQPNFYMTIGYEYDSDDAIRFFARTYRFIGGYYDAEVIWLGEKTNNKLVTLCAGKTYFGNGITSAAPVAGYLYGTGGSGSNVVGGTLYLGPGPSTGNATPSAVVIQSTVAGSSGSTAQTLVDTLTVKGRQILVADGTLAAPAVAFASEVGSGIYRIGSANWGFVVGGVIRGQFSYPGGASDTTYFTIGKGGTGNNATASLILNAGSGSTANNASITCQLNGATKGLFGTCGSADSLITGSVSGDFAIRNSQRIIISVDAGSTVLCEFNSTSVTLADAKNLAVGTTTGTKIGTAASQKIGLWNATPIVQPTTGYAEAAFTENAGGTAVNDDSTFDGYTLRQVVAALRGFGLLA